MRVCAVADKRIDGVDHPVRHIGVQVECRDDRHVRPDDVADALEHDAFGVVLLGRDRRAMSAEIDAIDRQGRCEPALEALYNVLTPEQKAVVDHPFRR